MKPTCEPYPHKAPHPFFDNLLAVSLATSALRKIMPVWLNVTQLLALSILASRNSIANLLALMLPDCTGRGPSLL
jgi:hypothetical protein